LKIVDLSKFSRREFMRLAAVAVPGFGLAGSDRLLATTQRGTAKAAPLPRSADEALRDLLAGNQRFAKGQPSNPRRSPEDFRELAEGQYPSAVIVSCSDSRVAPEILFDVGKGDIFVVRMAVNVVGGAAATVKGSIEYAIAELNVPLIMVLGHTNCGAVKAAMKHIDANDSLPGAINELVELIKPVVTTSTGRPGDPLDNAIRANVLIGAERLKGLEPIVARGVNEARVKVVGAIYDLHSGKVTVVV
jgi:carbonic anhydrase